jgi:hypothetical protein
MTAIADVIHTLDSLLELGNGPLLARHPGVGAMRELAGEASRAEGARYQELVRELESVAQSLYGGAGSFRDWGIGGADGDRFERLKDDLDRQLERL